MKLNMMDVNGRVFFLRPVEKIAPIPELLIPRQGRHSDAGHRNIFLKTMLMVKFLLPVNEI